MQKPLAFLLSVMAVALLSARASCQADEVRFQSGHHPSNLETDDAITAEIGDPGCSDPCAAGRCHATVESNAASCSSCRHCAVGFWGKWLCGACDMPPHCPYVPQMKGYYYFRPYNPAQLLQQKALVAQWGGDPRDPYDNAIFQQVYREQEAARAGLPETELFPAPPELPPVKDTEPPQPPQSSN